MYILNKYNRILRFDLTRNQFIWPHVRVCLWCWWLWLRRGGRGWTAETLRVAPQRECSPHNTHYADLGLAAAGLWGYFAATVLARLDGPVRSVALSSSRQPTAPHTDVTCPPRVAVASITGVSETHCGTRFTCSDRESVDRKNSESARKVDLVSLEGRSENRFRSAD